MIKASSNLEIPKELQIGDNQKHLPLLIEKMESTKGVIPFVGAGLSVDFGYRTWRDFLFAVSEEWDIRNNVSMLISDSKYEDAIHFLQKERTLASLNIAIDREYSADKITVSNIRKRTAAKLVSQFTQKIIITTNYDRVLETLFEKEGKKFEEIIHGAKTSALSKAIDSNRRTLLKIHGDVEEISDRILSKEDYNKTYGSKNLNRVKKVVSIFRQLSRTPLTETLSYLFNQNSILFIGCSLTVDRHLNILKEAVNSHRLFLKNFALLKYPKNAKKRTTDLSSYNIYPIWYGGEKGDHSQLIDLLEYVLGGFRGRNVTSRGYEKASPSINVPEIIDRPPRTQLVTKQKRSKEKDTLIGRKKLDNLLHAIGLGNRLNEIIERQDTIFKIYRLVHLDLSTLNMNENQLPKSAFDEFSDLVGLNLSQNKLSASVMKFLSPLNSLSKLDLSHNVISSLPEGIFNCFEKLKIVNLSGNKINILPDLIFNTTSGLTEINLKGNLIESLSENIFGKNSRLKVLDLQNNKLTTLEEKTLKKLSFLVSLNLGNNQISHINKRALSYFPNLRRLYLNYNKINDLDSDIFKQLSNLNELHLEGNRLTKELDPNIFQNSRNLKHLSLQGCGLTDIPESLFDNLSNLRILNIARNEAISLPNKIFRDLINLEKLYLNYNKISSLQQNLFQQTKKLITLALGNNEIKDFPEEIFKNLSELKYLNMSNNSIEKLPNKIFNHLFNLTHLDLSNNQIKEVPDSVFNVKNLSSLIEINLAQNINLKVLPASLVEMMDHLERINLKGTALPIKEHRSEFVGKDKIRELKDSFINTAK